MAAENSFNPTAANVLSSLKIKGASVLGGTNKGGFVPILGEDGQLDISTIPIGSIRDTIDINPLKKTAFVDANADTTHHLPTGSIAAPFKTLRDAAGATIVGALSSQDRYTNFVLVPGEYGSENVFVNSSVHKICVFGLGTSTLNSLTFSEYADGTVFELYNISVNGSITFASDNSCTLKLIGQGTTNSVLFSDSRASGTVYIGADYHVNAVSDNAQIKYIPSGDEISNNGTTVPGETIADALENLNTRKIKIPVISVSEHGIAADSEDEEIIQASSSDNIYSIVKIGTSLVDAANRVFHKDGDSPVYSETTSRSVVSTDVKTSEITTSEVRFGIESALKAIIIVDSSDFLTIKA